MSADLQKKKHRKASIKWKIFFSLLIFTALILLLMWLCQSVFLNDIYKTTKVEDIKDAAEKIISHLGDNDFGKLIDKYADEGGMCVELMSISKTDDGNFEYPLTLYSNHRNNFCIIHTIDIQSYMELFESTRKSGGKELQRFKYDQEKRKYIPISGNLLNNNKEKDNSEDANFPESIVYSYIKQMNDAQYAFLVLNSEITPVTATVKTMNNILIGITVITVIVALIIAIVLSRIISKPIANLTDSAKELAKGNYNVNFDENTYKEASELSGALNYAENELGKTDQLRKELIANISHDLRTPLTLITGYSEVMKDIPGENTPENIQVIIDESKRLSSLVDDVLDVSKLESGVGKNEYDRFDLTESVKKTIERFSKLCEGNGYTIEFKYDCDASVYADESRINQALYNLIGNAITHTDNSQKIDIEQSIVDSPNGNGKSVRISVTDYGEGIPSDQLPLIWDRYYKVDKVHKRAQVGSGLGLSIVRKIMELNNGGWGVKSQVGQGSTFWIELPVLKEENDE